MSRTLVVAPNWVGDVVMCLPVFEALADSGRELVALAKPGLHSLLRLVPGIVETVAKESSNRQTVDNLRSRPCDEAVILPNSFRSAWLPYRAAVPIRRGYGGSFRSPLLSHAVPRPRQGQRHQVEAYRELLSAMGVATPEPLELRLELTAEAERVGREALERAGVRLGEDPLVGLFPGAEFGASKRWPIDRFVETSTRLRGLAGRARQVLLAGPKDAWVAARIHERTGRTLPIVGADLDLAGLAGLLSKLDLLVTNDSGPMHLAAALGVPCVAIFGPTDPALTSPWGDHHQVLYTDRWCSPCFRRRCPLLHHKCMKQIEASEVVDRVLKRLA